MLSIEFSHRHLFSFISLRCNNLLIEPISTAYFTFSDLYNRPKLEQPTPNRCAFLGQFKRLLMC